MFLDYFVVNLQTFVALDKIVFQTSPLNSSLFELHQRQQTSQNVRQVANISTHYEPNIHLYYGVVPMTGISEVISDKFNAVGFRNEVCTQTDPTLCAYSY